MEDIADVLDGSDEINDPKGFGSLYVMRERDLLTGDSNDYFKIGIVNGLKTLDRREKDHQTGNPRNIWTYREWLNVPAVQRLETRFHNTFALDRISSGEWFYLPGEQLQRAIDEIENMHEHHTEAFSNLLQSEPMRALRECKAKLEFSEHVLGLAQSHEMAANSLTIHKKNRELIRQKIVELVGGSEEYAQLFKKTTVKESKTFLASIAKDKFPDIAPNFEIVKDQPRKLFFTLPKPAKDEIKSEITKLIVDNAKLNSSDPIELHQAFLHEWSLCSQREWDLNAAKWEIQALCGEHLGVEGLVEWRPMSKKDFDRAAFAEKHPDQHAQCFKIVPKHVTLNIAEWASYGR